MIAYTGNSSTVQIGQSIATCLCKTVPETTTLHKGHPKPIVTWELVYPRYIHSEVMTHRMFSRNASSSRATPSHVMCSEVIDDPVFFDFVGKNQRGMVSSRPLDAHEMAEFRAEWELLGKTVAEKVLDWNARFKIHKQTVNRALEPWLRMHTVITTTDIDNFFVLRLAEDAQPEIRNLAMAMRESMIAKEPTVSDYHIPYAEYFSKGLTKEQLITKSVAACARVSVIRHDGKKTSVKEDEEFFNSLLSAKHMSPFEHVAFARPCNERWENLTGWRSLRAKLEGKPVLSSNIAW